MGLRYRILSSNWLGLLLAAPVCAAGMVLLLLKQMIVGVSISALGLVMAACAGWHLYRVLRFRQRFPAPGRFVTVDGVPMHYLAEGEVASAPTVVWIPGSHDPGIEMWDLHKCLSVYNRSIIYDRLGSGWSGVSSTPRSPFNEAGELYDMLQKAGETGPFVLVGHSLGAMLATCFAYRFRQSTAGLVLLDAGTADNFAFVSKLRGPRNIPGDSPLLAVMAAFGMLWGRLRKGDPHKYDESALGQMRLGIMAQPKSHAGWVYALNAVFDDLLNLVRLPGALGDVPLYAIIPDGQNDTEEEGIRRALPGFSELQIKNLLALHANGRRANAELSSAGELVLAPPGTGHDLPNDSPEFVLAKVREMIDRVVRGAKG